MKNITLGSTGITVPQNAFGALPVQRVSKEDAVYLLNKARDGGMKFFDTARAYSDSEEKIGEAFGNNYEGIYIATKTGAKTPEGFWKDLQTSLTNLKIESIDIYQFHCADQCYRPNDGTGMYEAMLEAKEKGLIKHIGITAHKIGVALEAAKSGLYETIQFPFSYLAGPQELELVELCNQNNIGFICMKGLAGGLINKSEAAMAYISQYNVLPIWGIQRETELDEWLSYMDHTPTMTKEITEYIDKEKEELSGSFCRGCGYCMPCPVGITINQCARMSLMVRRAPSAAWLNDHWQEEMKKIENCLHCHSCSKKCPYELDTPTLLEENYEDYKRILSGEVKV